MEPGRDDLLEIDRLIEDVRAGNRESYRGVIALCEIKMRVVAASLLPNANMVDDVVQESFVIAFTKLGEYQIGTNFLHWIKAITRHVAQNERRRVMREMASQKRYRDHLRIENALSVEAPPYEKMALLDDHEPLYDCIDKLGKNTAEIFRARYLESLSNEDLAQQRGRPVAWVRVVLHRARLAVAQCLKSKGVLDAV